jgi:thiamine biosynthesis protein ThiS
MPALQALLSALWGLVRHYRQLIILPGMNLTGVTCTPSTAYRKTGNNSLYPRPLRALYAEVKMRIQVNDKHLDITEKTNLSQLLSAQNIDTSAVAVAMNGQIIHREQWQQTELKDNDTITLVQAVAGG